MNWLCEQTTKTGGVLLIIGWFCGKEILKYFSLVSPTACWRKQFYDLTESTQDSIVSATAPAILCVGYGLPFKVFYYGFQPLYSLLSSSSQYSRLSIESEIRPLLITNLHRSSLSTSFVFSTFLI
jgi:hypothetical protein